MSETYHADEKQSQLNNYQNVINKREMSYSYNISDVACSTETISCCKQEISREELKRNIWKYESVLHTGANMEIPPSSGSTCNNIIKPQDVGFIKNKINQDSRKNYTLNDMHVIRKNAENCSVINEGDNMFNDNLNVNERENNESKNLDTTENLGNNASQLLLELHNLGDLDINTENGLFNLAHSCKEGNISMEASKYMIAGHDSYPSFLNIIEGEYQEEINHHESTESIPCFNYSEGNGVPNNCGVGSDKESWSSFSNYSDREDDAIEEIIIKEKLRRINNHEEEVDSINDIVNGSLNESRVEDVGREKKELLICAANLEEAMELNISMRNQLYDLEHQLLKLIEGSRTETGMKGVKTVRKLVTNSNKKKRFYQRFMSPYFKDKRGFTRALYVGEDISENGTFGIEEFMKLYQYTYQPHFWDVYNATKQYFYSNFGTSPTDGAIFEKENNHRRKSGKKNVSRDSICIEHNEGECNAYSMESQLVHFLNTVKDRLQNFLDKKINWKDVSSRPSVQGLSASDCQKIWMLVLKPLLQLGTWSNRESEQVMKIAKRNKYQNWKEIAEELATGKTGYLCFCHVMSKSIQGVTQYRGQWAKEEDKYLLQLINRCSYGSSIVWSRIFYYFEGRTVSQVLNRWYRLNPALKKGKFSHHEDTMLLYCTGQFGRDFGKIATLFGNRSPVQLRERYFAIKDLTSQTKLGEWSVEEDRLLLNLIEEYGVSKWAKIASKFPGRNRVQIRHHYNSVLKRWGTNPEFQLETLKRHKRTVHIKSALRAKQIDTSEPKVQQLVQNKLQRGKATLKRSTRPGKHAV